MGTKLAGLFARVVLAATVVTGPALPAAADPIADFYRGKTVTFHIGTGVGSGADLAGRMIARNLARYIPGRPVVVVKNMAGAGGLQLFNYLYGAAPQDGTEIGSIVQFPFEYLFETGNTKAHFDAVKFRWIGGPVNAATIAVAWTASSAVRKPHDLMNQELIVGGSTANSPSATDAYVVRNVLGFKYKVTLGYPGGAELDLAMVRGETQGRASMTWSALQQRNPEWISDKKIAVLYQMGVAKSAQIPADVPLILDFAKTPEDRAVLELKFATNSMGYPIFAPPGIPQDRLAALRKALAEALNDPMTRADAAKLRIDIEPMTGAAIEAVVNKAHASPPAIIARLIEGSKPPN
jgi:tripartite-type tricarboxylate transporter receptor subunit TctC